MAIGCRIRDPVTGVIKMDLTTRLPRLWGTVDTGQSNGSISTPGLGVGTGWFMTSPLSGDGLVWGGNTPNVSMSGSTLSWNFPTSGSASNINSRIVYGIY